MTQPSQVDAVLFDLGGTLRRTTKRDDREMREYAELIHQQLGSDIPVAEFTRSLSERYQAYRQWAEQTMIELDEEQLWSRWLAPEYPREKIQELAPTLNRMWRDATGVREVYPEAVPVIQELYQRGYLLGVVSNTISRTEIPNTLEATGLSRCIKVVLLSTVFGKRKPDPAILLAAAEQLGVPSDRCAYIGNRMDRDVLGARRAGFATVIVIHHGHHPDKLPADPAVTPDHTVHNLLQLLDFFPPRAGSGANGSA